MPETRICFACKENKENSKFHVSDWLCKECRRVKNKKYYSRKQTDLMLTEEPFASLVRRLDGLELENEVLKEELKKYHKTQRKLKKDVRNLEKEICESDG